MSNRDIVTLLEPIIEVCRELDLSDTAASEARLESALPFTGEAITSLGEKFRTGITEGWLCHHGEAPVRYSRVAKSDDDQPFSIDAVMMEGPGPRHRHPLGEVDLCFRFDGEPTFDGKPPGWVVKGTDSTHTPTVTGGSMMILYLLPNGEIEWVRE